VLDLGTGSGAIALVLKRQLPRARVLGVEASAAALALARRNAATLGLDVDLRHGRWFGPVPGERFDVVVSNPPYVAEGDPHLEQGDLRFEPRAALAGGADGLDAIREIVRGAPAHLERGGRLLLEHGLGQDAAVRDLMGEAGLEGVTTWPDLAGIARVTGGRLKS
jgi:release factor glutamine methyltransferase